MYSETIMKRLEKMVVKAKKKKRSIRLLCIDHRQLSGNKLLSAIEIYTVKIQFEETLVTVEEKNS